MSLNIEYLTNGKKSVVVVVNSGVSPTKIDYYDRPEDVPIEIRNYCPKEVKYVGPDSARLSCAQSVLYPNFPKCGHPEYDGLNCIAESCRFGDPTYRDCPYFDHTYDENKECQV